MVAFLFKQILSSVTVLTIWRDDHKTDLLTSIDMYSGRFCMKFQTNLRKTQDLRLKIANWFCYLRGGPPPPPSFKISGSTTDVHVYH
jgi:hypothetical protein